MILIATLPATVQSYWVPGVGLGLGGSALMAAAKATTTKSPVFFADTSMSPVLII